MLTMSQINYIRNLKKGGYSITDIHEETGADPKTIRKYLEMDDFSPLPPAIRSRTTILDPFKETIAEWIEEDRKHWNKQRHTAKRVYDRLCKEQGYTGSYDTVQKYIKNLRRENGMNGSKASQELIWEPGSAQVDFGEADFYEDTDCVRRKFLTISFPFSNDGYSQVFGGETAECVCQGLMDIFNYIGGVPPLLIFDNATGVGRRMCDGIHETDLFSRFRAHYGCEVRFTSPYAGYEKGSVENKVGYNRRNLFVPVPRYHDIEAYNRTLLDKHLIKASELHYKKQETIADLFEQDRAAFLPLPRKGFNACTYRQFKADGYGKVCIDGKHYYSTKPENRRQKIWIGLRAHYIDVLAADGSVLVRHKRAYGRDRTDQSDQSTALAVLSRNAGAWKNSGVRMDADGILREYLDHLSRPELRASLRLLHDLAEQYGYHAALSAMSMAAEHGSINRSDTAILAARITGYGIDTPPGPGPSLTVYDKAFLHTSQQTGGGRK